MSHQDSAPEIGDRDGAHTVAITGSSGMVGTALVDALLARGDSVVCLVRREPADDGDLRPGVTEVQWSPGELALDPSHLAGVDTVVNLAGAGIGDKRWTDGYKRLLRSSRIDSTTTIAAAVAAQDTPPRLISGSAVGYYGDRGSEILTELSGPGDGFLADLCREWEDATAAAAEAGASIAFLRTGIILSPTGGAIAKMLPLAKVGLAGPLGSGRQYWPWITLHDHVRAILHLVANRDITGPVNLSAPQAEPQRDVASALGQAVSRPAVLPAPGFALRIGLGEFAGDMLASQRMAPQVLIDAGFAFEHPDLISAMRWVVAEND